MLLRSPSSALLPLPLVLLLPSLVLADDSCRSECHHSRQPNCGVWLVSEPKGSSVSGSYQLSLGVANLSCAFTSLPEPVNVRWKHRATVIGQWAEFPCSSKDEAKRCRSNGSSEHRVSSQCVIRLDRLNQTGSYLCEALTPDEKYKAYGSEVNIEVVGIEVAKLTAAELPFAKSGWVEAQVCANPQPEVYWVSKADGQLVRAGDPLPANSRIAATRLDPLRTRESASAPARSVPFCYVTRLIVSKVLRNDSFSLIVRNAADSQTVTLETSITQLPKLTSPPSLLISLSLLVSLLTLVLY